MTGGGLPSGRTTLLLGGPGSGKTIFSLQFLVQGASACKEPGIFVAFEEASSRIAENASTFGWDLAKDANFVLTFEKTGEVGFRHVTHVCRECGEHAVVGPGEGATWLCPYCGKPNPFGRSR